MEIAKKKNTFVKEIKILEIEAIKNMGVIRQTRG